MIICLTSQKLWVSRGRAKLEAGQCQVGAKPHGNDKALTRSKVVDTSESDISALTPDNKTSPK